MTKKPAKNKRKPTSNSGKDASPRGGFKSKQTKVQNTAGMETPGPQQTKIKFAPTVTKLKAPPTTPNSSPTETASAITPKPSQVVAHALTESPVAPSATANTESTPTEKDIETEQENTEKTEQENTEKPTTPDPTTTQTDNDDGNRKPAAKSSITKPPRAINNETFGQYKEIRYKGQIDAPPSDKPFPALVALVKKYIKTVQDTIGKHIYLAPWEKQQERTFPLIKTKDDVPDSRESLGIYLGTYVNPKSDGGKIYMNLRWVTFKKPPVPLNRFGMELSDALPLHKMSMNKQPLPCQAAKTCCIGWFMYSSKQINSDSFVIETKTALGIPEEVEIGISYRTIVNEYGKRPQYNRDDPPAAAIHLDIDERFYMVFQPKASSLWRKNSRKRLPNGVQLRLVPCFSSPIGKALTDEIRADAKLLAERQYFFVKEHIRPIEYHFISLLDTPASPENSMTLRRAMMARAPKDKPTCRLIHNVDQAWNQTTKHIVTTVVGCDEEANRFLANMIPEFLHVHGPSAAKWFTSQGLSVYKDVRWNPKKGTTSSANAKASAAMVKEDLWDLGEKWKTLSEKPLKEARPNEAALDSTVLPSTTDAPKATTSPVATTEKEQLSERMAGDKSVTSFGDTFGRELDSDDELDAATAAEEAAKNQKEPSGTQFIFNPAQLEKDHAKALGGYESDGRSMSTSGKTTDSTRLKLKETREELQALRLELKAIHSTPPKPKKSKKKKQPRPLPDMEGMSQATIDEAEVITTVLNIVHDAKATDPEDMVTEAQILGAAISRQPKESIQQDSDAMEEDEHGIIHIGSSQSSPSTDPSSPSSSSSSSSSSPMS